MRLKQLESLLEDVEPFREPNNELEQYPTGAHLAACVLTEAHARGDVDGLVVADLGVGGGVLAIASLLSGARRVVGVDVDPSALQLCRDNCDAFEPPLRPRLRLGSIPKDVARWNADPEAVRAADERDENDDSDDEDSDDASSSLDAVEKETRSGDDEPKETTEDASPLRADTVVMNPPFGTRLKGVDVAFIRCGLKVARRAVYSSAQVVHARLPREARDARVTRGKGGCPGGASVHPATDVRAPQEGVRGHRGGPVAVRAPGGRSSRRCRRVFRQL